MWRHFLLSLNIQTGTCIMGIHRNKFPVPRQFYNPSVFFFKLGLHRGRNLKSGSALAGDVVVGGHVHLLRNVPGGTVLHRIHSLMATAVTVLVPGSVRPRICDAYQYGRTRNNRKNI